VVTDIADLVSVLNVDACSSEPHEKSEDITDIVTDYTNSNKRKKSSMRHPFKVLQKYPSVDTYDSLLNFPSSLMVYFNSGNFLAISKLLNVYCDRTCTMNMNHLGMVCSHMCLPTILSNISAMSPDGWFYLKGIKVEENQIKAKLLFTGSISLTINKSLSAMSGDDNYYDKLVQSFDVDNLSKRLDSFGKSREELVEMLSSCEILQYSFEYDFNIMYHYVRNNRKAMQIDISNYRGSLSPCQ